MQSDLTAPLTSPDLAQALTTLAQGHPFIAYGIGIAVIAYLSAYFADIL